MRLVDVGVPDRRHRLFHRDGREVDQHDLRQHLDRHGVGKVGAALDGGLDLRLVLREGDLGLQRQLEAVVGDDLAVGLGHRRLDHLDHHRAAIEALQVRHRHLARPEAVDADPVLDLLDAGDGATVKVAGLENHAELALQAFVIGFGYLHGRALSNRRYVPLRAGQALAARPKDGGGCDRLRGDGAGGGARTPTTFVTGT